MKQVRTHWMWWVGIVLLWAGAAAIFLNTKPVGPKNVTPGKLAATPAPTPTPNRLVSLQELQAADGKAGRPCWASIKGTVYAIPDSSVWQDGQHLPSNNLVYCGQVGDDLIGRSPHGETVMASLDVVGQLK